MNDFCCKQSIIDEYYPLTRKRKRQIEKIISYLQEEIKTTTNVLLKFCAQVGSWYKDDFKTIESRHPNVYSLFIEDDMGRSGYCYFDSQRAYEYAKDLYNKIVNLKNKIKVLQE